MSHVRNLALATMAAFACADVASPRNGTHRTRRWGGHGTVEGQAIFRVMAGADIDEVIAGTGVTVASSDGDLTFLLQAPPRFSSSMWGALAANPGVVWAESNQNLLAAETAGCSVGASAAGQCTLAIFDGEPTPETYYGQPMLPFINAARAQVMSKGAPSIVAVIDTGVDMGHPVFTDRILDRGFDFVLGQPGAWDVENGFDDDGDGLVDEAFGHGTHVAGIIALINPDAQILPIRALDTDGNGTAFNVAAAIHYALDSGADVINLSLGMTGFSQAVDDALFRARDEEVTVVAAAGNTGTEQILFPAGRLSVIGVAALEFDETKAAFSAFGLGIGISAPGVEIYSAMPGGMWAWWSGTSMACAVTSGATSLLHSIDGNPDDAEGFDALQDTGIDVDFINVGLEDLLGAGRIDAEAGAFEILEGDDD